jgi:tetratricopeptide (TPR) repeat protein
MGQLLSFARRYYEEGRQLLAARRKTEALARFEDAKKKIQEVKIVFPINQEAGLLELRIDQVIDPEAFNAVFRRRLAEAQAKMKDRPQEGYSELQDLYEINPRYAGLKAIIEKAEIDLGLRLPPPDRAALTRSIDLTSTARRIVDANLRGQFPVALEQLNEALRLNPNNDQAVSLKDRIQTDVGGQAAVVLSNVAEKEYQRAVQELQKGNTIAALAIVEQLLRDPGNRNSPRIIELQRRIQSRL